MKTDRWFRAMAAAGMSGGVLLGTGPCTGEIFKNSVKEGIFLFVSGSLQGGLTNPQFNDFITDVFTGGFGNGAGGVR
jgi:hypothetical protein